MPATKKAPAKRAVKKAAAVRKAPAKKTAPKRAAPKKKAEPYPRIELFRGVDGRWFMRLVKRGGKITEHGSGGREGGYSRRASARRQAERDHPGMPIVNCDPDPVPEA